MVEIACYARGSREKIQATAPLPSRVGSTPNTIKRLPSRECKRAVAQAILQLLSSQLGSFILSRARKQALSDARSQWVIFRRRLPRGLRKTCGFFSESVKTRRSPHKPRGPALHR